MSNESSKKGECVNPTTPKTKTRSHSLKGSKFSPKQRENSDQTTKLLKSPLDLSHLIDRKMASLLDSPCSSVTPVDSQLIQVVVRCRRRHIDNMNVVCNDTTSVLSTSDTEDNERASDGIIEYEVEGFNSAQSTAKALPAVSLPSQVLASGGHGPRRRFEFDCVFPPWKSQSDVYSAAAHNDIQRVLNAAVEDAAPTGIASSHAGAHATFVAYGQTGTGKTYTMGLQPHSATKDDREYGIIPRAMVDILSRINDFNGSLESKRRGIKLEVSMSFLQIYLESIQDLLTPPGRSSQTVRQQDDRRQASHGTNNLQVRLDPSTNVFYVEGLSEIPIEQVNDARTLLELATHNRVLAATARNKTSSRSHTLLSIYIRRKRISSEYGAFSDQPCTVSFVDLAGSERVEGALHFLHTTRKRQELRIREAKFINRSLSALGSVIAALASQEKRRSRSRWPALTKKLRSPTRISGSKHIRFRDSQLTKLLQSRLMNGNGSLVLIATIDDQPANLAETLSTLKFAAQCRRVDLNQNKSKAEATRRQREETLLSQVFAEVKVMYEEREAALRKQYEHQLEVLERKLRSIADQQSGPVHLKNAASNAAYFALCSLVDTIRQGNQSNTSDHPPIDSFVEVPHAVEYIAELYREVKLGLLPPNSVNKTKNLGGLPVRKRRRKKTSENVEWMHSAGEVIDSSHGCEKDVRDAEFGAILQHFIVSGDLEEIAVSSEEDEAKLYNQLQ